MLSNCPLRKYPPVIANSITSRLSQDGVGGGRLCIYRFRYSPVGEDSPVMRMADG